MSRNSGNGAGLEYGEMGDRLREARQARGLSLRGLADRLGVSPSLISQVETGRAKPSVSTLYAIVTELGISLDELVYPDAQTAVAGTRAGCSRRGAERRDDAGRTRPAGEGPQVDPARVGRHLGAADDGLAARTSTSCT